LLEECAPIYDRAEQVPDVDEVKLRSWVCPVLGAVFDFAASPLKGELQVSRLTLGYTESLTI
jgi:hypothetical protein